MKLILFSMILFAACNPAFEDQCFEPKDEPEEEEVFCKNPPGSTKDYCNNN